MDRIYGSEEIRKIVRQERKRQGYSQARLSGLIGHTQKWLSDFESGKTIPNLDMTLEIMSLLGIKLFIKLPEQPTVDDTIQDIDMKGL